MKQVDVAVGVVYCEGGFQAELNQDTPPDQTASEGRHFFICRRSAQQHQGNKWEFPGGKVDADESPLDALTRELKEEIDIKVNSAKALMQIRFDYPDKRVCLHVFLVNDFDGHAKGAEGQESQWVSAKQLPSFTFPDANTAIIESLQQQGLI